MTAISDLLNLPATTVDSEHSTGNDINIIQVDYSYVLLPCNLMNMFRYFEFIHWSVCERYPTTKFPKHVQQENFTRNLYR